MVLSNEKLCERQIEFYKFLQNQLIFLQTFKKSVLEDYLRKDITKSDFKELIGEAEEICMLFNLAIEDIEGQLLEKKGEEFIRKLKGGQLNG